HARLLANNEDSAEDREHVLHDLDFLPRTRDHHRQRALAGTADAAAHRTVDLQDIFLCQRRSDFCRNTRTRGRQIDETLDALAVDDASLAGRDFLGNLQRRQAGHYGLDPVGDTGRGCGELRAQGNQGRYGVVARVVDDELVPRLDQAPSHRLSHVPQSDEADVHVFASAVRIFRTATLPDPRARVTGA